MRVIAFLFVLLVFACMRPTSPTNQDGSSGNQGAVNTDTASSHNFKDDRSFIPTGKTPLQLAAEPIPAVVPITPAQPTGVTPPPVSPPPAVTPPTITPPAVIPKKNDPPIAVVPPKDPVPPGITPQPESSNLLFPASCLTGVAEGYAVTNQGWVAKLMDSQGAVLSAGSMSMKAVTSGYACDSAGEGKCHVLRIDTPYFKKVPDGTYDGKFSLCYSEDRNAKPEAAVCKDLPSSVLSTGREVWQYIDIPVKYEVRQGVFKVTQYQGMPGDPAGENHLVVFHPLYLFANPQVCSIIITSPLVLDLDHSNDLELSDVWNTDAPIRFDFAASGHAEKTGWVGAKDGFLVLGNEVTSGWEMFGEFSQVKDSADAKGRRNFLHGFAALAQYDDNHDQKINSMDQVFSRLNVWRDVNQNARVDVGELKSLAELSIVEVSLRFEVLPKHQWQQKNRNEVRIVGTYKTSDKKEHLLGDVWFRQRSRVAVGPKGGTER